MSTEKLTWKQKDMIAQVEATMRIENMPVNEAAHQNLVDLASGKKTADQIAEEIKEKYKKPVWERKNKK